MEVKLFLLHGCPARSPYCFNCLENEDTTKDPHTFLYFFESEYEFLCVKNENIILTIFTMKVIHVLIGQQHIAINLTLQEI